MHQRLDDYGTPPGLPPERPRGSGGFNPRSALLAFAFATFVLGGFVFGWLAINNWKLLSMFQAARIQIPGGPVVVVPPVPDPGRAPRAPGSGVVVPPVQVGAAPGEVAEKPNDDYSDLPEWTARSRLNILLLGIDHRDDEPIDGSRSDTIMVASIDPPSKSVVLVSLPRDMYVSIPGYYQQRINVAHAVGGPTLVAQTIQANFGIKIDKFARVDFSGFEQVIDAVGGVIIDVERPVKDDEYPTDDYGVMRLFIPPGPILLDGKR